MSSSQRHTFVKNQATAWPVPNTWDWLALILLVALVFFLGWGASGLLGQYTLGQSVTVSLSPQYLPYYAGLTVLRMFIALFFSLLFTFTVGTWAAKSPAAERILIPLIDLLQSVPVLGFLSITVVGFIVLFRGSMLGPECAAIFAIFTAQVWNMTLSFYQSLKQLPDDLKEASLILQLSSWQQFWRVEVPFAMPGLIWNVMLSLSSSWIFLVASEAISVARQKIFLPGVGSYIATAIADRNLAAIGYVIITMSVVIWVVDQLFFRPLVAWSEKFRRESAPDEEEATSWVLDFFQRTRLCRYFGACLKKGWDGFVNARIFKRLTRRKRGLSTSWHWPSVILWRLSIIVWLVWAVWVIVAFIIDMVTLTEMGHVVYYGLITALRVFAAIIVSSLIWVPVGVWVGMRPRVMAWVQPVAQWLAAFPMNLVYPAAVWCILRYHLSVDLWVSPLMVLGAQWYILFNVIAGAAAIPKNLHHAAGSLGVKGSLWWRKLVLPALYPYYITGVITAAGAAWNVSILVEALEWGTHKLWAHGLGAYIVKASLAADYQRLALGIVTMALYVLVINHCVWRPLHQRAQERFKF